MCERADEHYAAMALMKRSPKMTANWAFAMSTHAAAFSTLYPSGSRSGRAVWWRPRRWENAPRALTARARGFPPTPMSCSPDRPNGPLMHIGCCAKSKAKGTLTKKGSANANPFVISRSAKIRCAAHGHKRPAPIRASIPRWSGARTPFPSARPRSSTAGGRRHSPGSSRSLPRRPCARPAARQSWRRIRSSRTLRPRPARSPCRCR